ncbi:imm11 family protein [Jannaschia pohangensis]|uniref:Immunity MXAN-0049 protein domain-containing protein n=1 Tax=Jannaschia pohangensis TaxID=390807 RepID=A0A1I3SDN7_9RHOB|nr:DUF1629 domain-containing protein [Jannaschia pohangensis]SFJ56953.1 hypothetical protein SAMN04488095_3119 [Jannaschia pohangensis]
MAWVVRGTVNPPYYVRVIDDDKKVASALSFGLDIGRPIDPEKEAGPNKVRLYRSGATEKRRKLIPAIMARGSFFYVSETFRQLVEAFEPGRHQFFPYALRNGKKGPPAEEPYYILNITNRADSMNLSEWQKEQVYRPPNKYMPEPRIIPIRIPYDQDDHFSLRRDEVAGFHLWREATIFPGFFVSEEFLARFDALRLKKLERVHVLET